VNAIAPGHLVRSKAADILTMNPGEFHLPRVGSGRFYRDFPIY
jgi:hypothetical protein